jgi:hypothetical protein
MIAIPLFQKLSKSLDSLKLFALKLMPNFPKFIQILHSMST